MLKGRWFLTGGAGYLGRGIMRAGHRDNWPCEFTVYSRDEHNQVLCREKFPDAQYILGDVQDAQHLLRAMDGHDGVIHAAALKFIPEGETNANEVVEINIGGSQIVSSVVIDLEIPICIAISTDKAVQPVNIYGATKMVVERMWANFAIAYKTRFQTVRYGNVVGSTGSVIPIMQRSIAETGHVKVTNPRMTRFWMSVDMAVDCILQAASEKSIPGSVMVPRPQAMSMNELAVTLLSQRHGYVKDLNDFINIVGARLGEKEHEHLISYQEQGRVIRHNNYYEVLPQGSNIDTTQEMETVSSQFPPAGFVKPEEMLKWISDARNI